MEFSRRAHTGGTAGTAATAGRFAVVVAACAALLTFGRFVDEPGAAAETAYLAALAAVLLGAVAALDSLPGGDPLPRRALTGLSCAATLTVLAAWTLLAGPGRGAAVVTLLAVTVAWAGFRRLSAADIFAPPPAAASPEVRLVLTALRAAGPLVPLAVAMQALLRGRELLLPRPDLHTLVVFLAMPAAAAAAVALLAVRRGRGPALLAGATAVLLTGGLDVAATTALVALAAGELLRRPAEPSTAAGSPATTRRGRRLLLALAVAALVLPFAWQIRVPAVAAAAALLIAGRLLLAVPVIAAVVAAALLSPLHTATEVRDALGLGLLLLPFLPWSLGDVVVERPRRAIAAAGGVLLAVAAARCAPPGALAAPLAFLALTLAGPRGAGAASPTLPPVRRNVLVLQGLWSGALLAAAALVAAYPWLRPHPAATVLTAVGLDAGGWQPVWVAAAAFLLAALPSPGRLARRGSAPPDAPAGPREYAGTAALVAFLLAAPALPTSLGRTPLGSPGALLTAAEPRVEVPLDRRRGWPLAEASTAPRQGDPARQLAVSELVLDGNLVHAAGLADGTPVATVILLSHGARVATWRLSAGDDLAEWAARRPDLAPLLAHRAPPPWTSWVAPGGGYFGQTYRASHRLDTAVEADRLVVARHPGLPPEVSIHVHRLETWP